MNELKDVFKDINSHQNQLEFLTKSYVSSRLAHAYLFEGPSGIGKRTIAEKFIGKILCEGVSDIKLYNAGNHCDFMIVKPSVEEKKHQINTAVIEQIRDFLSTAPQMADKKVVLIDDCDKMNLHAQNKILKLVEEPPSYAMFFLISSRYELLLDTLKSRLVKISFNDFETSEEKIYSSEKGESSSLAKDLIAAIENNNAIKIFDIIKKLENDKDEFPELLNALEFSRIKYLNINNESKGNFESSQKIANKMKKYLEIIAQARYGLSRNLQKDLLISSFVYKLQGAINDRCD